jgi:hypothetical protein
VTFTYPLLDAHMRKSHPGDLVALHRMQGSQEARDVWRHGWPAHHRRDLPHDG